jgi:hypothetical protein
MPDALLDHIKPGTSSWPGVGAAAGGAPRVKASQCFTKYLWRDEAEAGEGPAIVATQVGLLMRGGYVR